MRVIDTSVAVDLLRGRKEAVELVDRMFSAGEPLLASEVTRFEVLAGVRPKEVAGTERLLERMEWIPVDERVARSAAAMARAYRASHSGIDDEDYFVAATAMDANAALLTTNVRHFPMFESLEPAY
jgi:predicted nucleic acid-binding protein